MITYTTLSQTPTALSAGAGGPSAGAGGPQPLADDLPGQGQHGGGVVQDEVGVGGQDDAVQLEHPPGNVRRSRYAKNASHTAVSCARPGGAASAGCTTSSAKIRAASATVASWSSVLEPKCACRPLLLIPTAAATLAMDKLSSPSTATRAAAARTMALRVRSPSPRDRRGPELPGWIASFIVAGNVADREIFARRRSSVLG